MTPRASYGPPLWTPSVLFWLFPASPGLGFFPTRRSSDLWVLTWVVSVALLLVRSLSVVVVEALAVLDRSVVRRSEEYTTELQLRGQLVFSVPRFKVTVLVMPL